MNVCVCVCVRACVRVCVCVKRPGTIFKLLYRSFRDTPLVKYGEMRDTHFTAPKNTIVSATLSGKGEQNYSQRDSVTNQQFIEQKGSGQQDLES